MNRIKTTLLVVMLFGIPACEKKQDGQEATSESDAGVEKTAKVEAEAKAPDEPGAYGPSFATLEDKSAYDLETHLEVDACAECHGEIVGEWSASTHALASIANPFYRAAFEDFADTSGRDKTPFCGGCHDPALLFDHRIKKPLEPSAERTHAGITCNTCHGAVDATTDGNGSYTIATAEIELPKDGDDASLAAHIKRMNPAALRTNKLCISCHRGFLTPDSGHDVVISGIDEWAPWRGSAYADNDTGRISDTEPQNCVGCHMPEVDGHRSHRFPGGHSTLASMTGEKAQIEAVEKMVKSAATVDIPAYGVDAPSRGIAQTPAGGDTLWFDVVIFNRGTGHVFPGGARDLRDTWLEVEIRDANGELVKAAGTDHEETGDDPSAYVLQAYMANRDGRNIADHSVHDFRAAVYNHTIDPEDARVARYRVKLPENLTTPLKVEARLKHRRLTESFRKATCEFSKRESDQPFAAAAQKIRGFELDPCDEQPVILIDSFGARLDGSLPEHERISEGQRHYERGLGLAKHLAENLQEALDAFDAAMKATPENQKRDRARIHLERGKVLARQGRTPDAMDEFKKAENLIGEHAAIHYARGRAHQRVFRNDEAVKWLEKARALQKDARILRQLAIAAGSVSNAELALEAAQAGLEIEPRDPHLLRSQMLALRKLEAEGDEIAEAREAFSSFKRDEEAAQIRDKCAANDARCRVGRLPIRIIEID